MNDEEMLLSGIDSLNREVKAKRDEITRLRLLLIRARKCIAARRHTPLLDEIDNELENTD